MTKLEKIKLFLATTDGKFLMGGLVMVAILLWIGIAGMPNKEELRQHRTLRDRAKREFEIEQEQLAKQKQN
jgi:hypothetical protein